MDRIDAHHHLWDLERAPQRWIEPGSSIDRDFAIDDLSPVATQAGIDAAIVVQTVHSSDETRRLLALAATEPFLAGVIGWTHLGARNVRSRIAELQTAPGGSHLVGIRHLVQSESERNWFDRPVVRDGIAAVGIAGLVYDLLVLPDQLDATVRLVRELPAVTFVLDHLAKPPYLHDLSAWSEQIHSLAESENVACKVSGLVTEVERGRTPLDFRPAFDVVHKAFGSQRLLFGSDWPVCLLAASYEEVLGLAETLMAGSSTSERDAFFGGNAARIYGLTDQAARQSTPK